MTSASEWFVVLRDITIIFAGCMLLKYWLLLMFAPWHSVKETLRRRRLYKHDPGYAASYRPLVSVVVPAWNEEVGIIGTVQSLINNTYDNLEIIVVNDGSDDQSDAVVRRFLLHDLKKDGSPKRIRYFYQPNGGKGSALNTGVEQANGDILVTMDADSIFEPNAIETLVGYFADPKIDAAVGNVKIARNNTLIGHLQQLEYLFGFYFKRAHSFLDAEYIYGGACAAFRRQKTFDRFGLFDTVNKTEDIEMSLRTRYHGLHAVFADEVICHTEGAATLTSLVNQRLRWKKGRIETFGKYRQLFFSLKRRHNTWLCFFILPYSLLGELQLLFEPIGITLLVGYSLISGDYLSLGLGLLFIFVSYLVVGLFNQKKVDWKIILKFPFTWPLFYLTTWVEYIVLLKSMKMILRGGDITWQHWERRGVDSRTLERVVEMAHE
ncbi:MAG TPA: glycosyltransferase [Candidatus Saccharimonadales bacterium]|nr:glycosyltransferase [Candidatus Saccharimonadales bacterium]